MQDTPRPAWRVVASRNFGPYFLGNASSATGTWFHNLAASILVYRLTHSPFLLGVLNFSQFIPVLLLAPWAGRVADAYDRRSVLLVTQPAAAATSGLLAVLAATGHATQWTVIAFSLCLGSLNAFTNAAQMAMVGSLVPAADLPQAVALNSITFNLARAVGPAAAAGVIAAFGTTPAFAVNTLSFLIFTCGLLVIRPEGTRAAKRSSLRASLAVLRADRRLLAYIVVVMTVSFVTDPINTEGPAIAHRIGLAATWTGALVGIFGSGAVLAGFTIAAKLASPKRLAITVAAMGVGMFGIAVAGGTVPTLFFAAVAGFGYLSSNSAATTLLQLGVDQTHRGRVMALWSVAFLGIRPIASFVDGTLASVAGIRAAVLVMALPAFAVAFALYRGARASAAELSLAD